MFSHLFRENIKYIKSESVGYVATVNELQFTPLIN